MKTTDEIRRLVEHSDHACKLLRRGYLHADEYESILTLIQSMRVELVARIQPERELVIRTASALVPAQPNNGYTSGVRGAVTLARELISVVDEMEQRT